MIASKLNKIKTKVKAVARSELSPDIFTNCKDGLNLKKPFHTEWFTVTVLMISQAWLSLDQNFIAPNLSRMGIDLGLDPTEVDEKLGGELQLGFQLLGGICAMFIGPLSDKYSRKNLLSFCLMGSFIANMVTGFSSTFNIILIMRVISGISCCASFPIMMSIVGDMFPPSQRTTMLSLVAMSEFIATSFGQTLSGLLGPTFGWQSPFLICSPISLFLFVLIQLLVEEPERENSQDSEHMNCMDLFGKNMLVIISKRTNQLIGCASIFVGGSIGSIFTYANDYLVQDQHMDNYSATLMIAIGSLSSMVWGMIGGFIGQKIYDWKKEAVAIFMSFVAFASIPPWFCILNKNYENGISSIDLILVAAVGTCAAAIPVFQGILINSNACTQRGSAVSLQSFCLFLGKGIGPRLIACIGHSYSRQIGLNCALLGIAFCGIFLLLTYWTIPFDNLSYIEKSSSAEVAALSPQDLEKSIEE